jgi:predicted outer membrane protein
MKNNLFIHVMSGTILLFGLSACSAGGPDDSSQPDSQPTATISVEENTIDIVSPESSSPATPPIDAEETIRETQDPALIAEENTYDPPVETAAIKELQKIQVSANSSIEYSKIGLMRTQNSLVREFAAITIDKAGEEKKEIENQITKLGYIPTIDSSEDDTYKTIILLMDSSDEKFDAVFVKTMLEQEKQTLKYLKKVLEVSSAQEKQALESSVAELVVQHEKNINELNKLQKNL